MTTRNGQAMIQAQEVPDPTPGSVYCDRINFAVNEFFRGKRDTETWVYCAFDNTHRRLDQVRALVVVR